MDTAAVERATQEIGADILSRIERARPPEFMEQLLRDPLERWSERGPAFLANVFRFIDVYPALKDDAELLEYLADYVGDPALFLSPETAVSAGAVRQTIRSLQDRFIAGETLKDALERCRALHDAGMCFTLDVLGEAVISQEEEAEYLQAYLKLIVDAAQTATTWPVNTLNSASALPRVNVSVKPSSLYSRLDPMDQHGSFEALGAALRLLFRVAREYHASINVDMEQYVFKDLTLDVFKKVLMEDEFRSWPRVSITVQTYLPESRADLESLAQWARERGTPVNVRLAKGAYWDHEMQLAEYRNWPKPVYTDKQATDAAFESATRFLLENADHLHPAIAGHNVRSVAHAMAVAQALGLPKDRVEYQTLYGLGDELKRAVADMGYRMRVYVPYGRLRPGMAYLVRRLLEATSRSAFLRQMWASPLPVEDLLKPPRPPAAAEQTTVAPAGFINEPVSDFSRRLVRDRMNEAIDLVRNELGRFYPLRIAGEEVLARNEMASLNPGRKSEIVGRVARASARDASRAVRAAQAAFPGWAARPAAERAAFMRRAAEILRRRRFELAAWELFETAKSWREADADVAEALDYLNFYSAEAERLARPRRRNVLGEKNEYLYEPRGVAATIAPWNFPLAILTGMTSAAAVAGNAVIMKPAEQSSVVAAKLMEVFIEAKFPPGVIQYLPGRGEEVGEHLARHPDVHLIAFTGSLEVGRRINRLAAAVADRGPCIKRVIAEMGGKNAVIVDRDADLDQAVPGVLASAFGYQGQKCSACSRAVVHHAVLAEFVDRLVEAARTLPVGPAWDPHAAIGPLISEEAADRVRRYVEVGRTTATVAFEGDIGCLADEGWYVPPVILTDVDPSSPVAQEEIFGPVLCVIRANDFDHALAIANDSKYGLTGGLYCRSPKRIAQARAQFEAGNVYVNRPITGALVDRQPFGGLKLSGIGSKAGGPDYLLQFMQPKTFAEYTVRRGFAPPPEP